MGIFHPPLIDPDPREKHYETKISCSRKTRELLKRCREEYIAHHPELKGINLSDGIILRRVMEYYLSS